LQSSARLTLRELTRAIVERWLDVELPKVQNLRLDLLGETSEGDLVHLELQSSHDWSMALRMAEYCLGVFRLFGKFPRQVLLYVGEAPLRMAHELSGPDVSFRYRSVDIRDLDGDRLLESEEVGDNVIAILARLRDRTEAVRKIVGRIARLEPPDRERALGQLLILSGLRRLTKNVEQEAKKMPIYIDLMENEYLAPAYKRGLQEGELKGELKGRIKGELAVLRPLIEKRFGALPKWAEERLAGSTISELEKLSERLLDAQSVEDLLK
jgi:hypothetical protein